LSELDGVDVKIETSVGTGSTKLWG